MDNVKGTTEESVGGTAEAVPQRGSSLL